MRRAEANGNNDCPVKIKLVAPPLYVLATQTLDKVSAILTRLDMMIGTVIEQWSILSFKVLFALEFFFKIQL